MKTNLLTHNDLDGAGCWINFRAVPAVHDKINKVYPVTYKWIDEKLKKSAEELPHPRIIVADLALTQAQADYIKDNFYSAYIFDHHPGTETVVFGAKDGGKHGVVWSDKKSATMLVYGKYKESLTEKHRQLSLLINDYDVFKLKYAQSLWLNELYWHYGFWDFSEMFKNGLETKFLKEGKELWTRKEEKWKAAEKLVIDDTIIMFGTEFLTNAMIQNPTNIISVNTPTKMSVRSTKPLEDFYLRVTESLSGDIINVGGHKYAGGIEFHEDITDDMVLKVYNLLED